MASTPEPSRALDRPAETTPPPQTPPPGSSIPIASVPEGPVAASVAAPPEPPKPQRLTPERLALEMARLDRALVAVLLGFAFFLGSFAAHNSDFWMHLATGRLIAAGEYHFGADPFAYTTPQTGWAWVNHSWLADLVLFQAADLLGGPESPVAGAVLVAGKALLVAALAGVMLLIRRPGQSVWIPVACTALAVLAMSPRLFLQPRVASYLLLALTLYLLQRPPEARPARRPARGNPAGSRWPWRLLLLPLLFVLWVNLDSWFLLGPLTVGLFLLGEVIQQAVSPVYTGDDSPRPGELWSLGVVLIVGLAACLLNPFHVHAFTLPTELWAWRSSDLFRSEPLLKSFLYPSVRSDTFTNPAGLAYVVLVVLGLASFYANRVGWRWWRALLWMTFAILSFFLDRALPFFAVVGGPVMALNWQDFAARRFGTEPSVEKPWKLWSLLGRLGSLAAGVALLALAWPGWLHPGANDPRRTHRVAWEVVGEPSYRRAALKLRQLWEGKVLKGNDHGFNFGPEIANYLAWYCPQEKCFFDLRFQLFPEVISSYLDVHDTFPQGGERAAVWQKLFRDPRYRINHIIISGYPSLEVSLFVARRCWQEPEQWVMLYEDGRTGIFGWKDPRDPDSGAAFAGHALDFNALAFGRDLPAEDRVPETGPAGPPPRTWWDHYVRGPGPRPLDRDEAVMYLEYYQVSRRQQEAKAGKLIPPLLAARWISSWAQPAAGASGLGSGCLYDPFLLANRSPDVRVLYEHLRAGAPSGAPLLAVRAARRAVAANPEYADAYATLALAYQVLWREQEEPLVSPGSPLLPQLRPIQAVTALQNALALRPDDPQLHLRLAGAFQQMRVETFFGRAPRDRIPIGFFDLEVEHLQEYLKTLRAAGPPPNLIVPSEGGEPRRQTDEEFRKALEAVERQIKQREEAINLNGRRGQYEVFAQANHTPLEKAYRAIDLGLIKQALEVLQSADATQFKEREVAVEVYLFLVTGQAAEVHKADLQLADREAMLYAGAVGNYPKVADFLEQSLYHQEQADTASLLQMLRLQAFPVTVDPASPNKERELAAFPQRLYAAIQSAAAPIAWADSYVLRGVIALEEGNTEQATRHLEKGLALSVPPLGLAGWVAPLAGASPLEALVWQAGTYARRDPLLIPFNTQRLAYQYLKRLKAAGQP